MQSNIINYISEKFETNLNNFLDCEHLAIYGDGVISGYENYQLTFMLPHDISVNDIDFELIHKKLPHLKSLAIRGVDLSNQINPIIKFHKLQKLDLSSNIIQANNGANELSKLTDLPHLKFLNLSNNYIGDNGMNSLLKLDNLSHLYLSENHISDIGAQKIFENINQLQSLDLSENRISGTCLDSIKNLRQLKILNLSSNKIQNDEIVNKLPITASLSYLKNIVALDLSFNSIGNYGTQPLRDLKTLKVLKIKKCSIDNDGIEFLQKNDLIEYLDLSSNFLSDDSLEILDKKTNLKTLDLTDNNISNLTLLFSLISKGLEVYLSKKKNSEEGIFVGACPIINPPMEIVNGGSESILNYIEQMNDNTAVPLREAKLLVVGEGEAGKSTLVQQLLKPSNITDIGATKSTKGIEITEIYFNKENPFKLNIWDFAGQHIYYNTHQFFLTKRSLYLLVDSTRSGDEVMFDRSFRYWLDVIETLSDRSSVIIFQNHHEGRSKLVDKIGIKERYPNVVEIHEGDALEAKHTISIQRAIMKYAETLPHVGDLVPAPWKKIREEIEKLSKNYPVIELEQYLNICKNINNNFDRQKSLHLSKYFHDLGIFLHFQDDILLENIIILQNRWATDAVFRIVDDEQIKSNSGRFNLNDCSRIWHEHHYRKHIHQLLSLLEKFDFCYKLQDINNRTKTWLATQLIRPSRPDNMKFQPDSGDVRIKYKYQFMPKGLLNRLMVRLNEYILSPELSWCNGLYFQSGESELLAYKDFQDTEINLCARGKDAYFLRKTVIEALDELNSSFDGLKDKVSKWVPCKCKKCSESSKPYFYERDSLIRRKKQNRTQVECDVSYYLVNIDILLEGIEHGPNNSIEQMREYTDRYLTTNRHTPKKIKIFIASSKELENERNELELHISRLNKHFDSKYIFEVVRWEYFLDNLSLKSKQNDYNKYVKNSDIFISLFKTKAGRYTLEEFEVAFKQFTTSEKRPIIYTYFYDSPMFLSEISIESQKSLEDFKENLKNRGHYLTMFRTIDQLLLHFRSQLDLLDFENILSNEDT